MKTTKGHDLGRAASLLIQIQRGWAADEEFGSAMGAPMGELRPIINRGRAKQMRRARRLVKSITGLKWRVFFRELERRTSARWVYFNLSQLEMTGP